jgi:hypothetical protein
MVMLFSVAAVSAQSSINSTKVQGQSSINSTKVQNNLLPVPILCSKAIPQIEDPVEMDTVNIGAGYIKTIYAEKEIFGCQKLREPIGISFYRDITLLLGLVSHDGGPHDIGAKVTACERDNRGEILSCSSSLVPLTSKRTAVSGCVEEQPLLPVEMNTVSSNDSGSKYASKSVIAEKHTYKCIFGNSTFPNKIRETLVFTMQGMDRTRDVGFGSNWFVGVDCFKDIVSTNVQSCRFSNINSSSPS